MYAKFLYYSIDPKFIDDLLTTEYSFQKIINLDVLLMKPLKFKNRNCYMPSSRYIIFEKKNNILH